jgi:hypothetical protein
MYVASRSNSPKYEFVAIDIEDMSFYIHDVNTGELAHREPTPGGFIWHFAVNENRLFVQTDRQLIAYEPWHLREN